MPTSERSERRWLAAVGAAVALAAAAPPAWFPGAEFAVVPGFALLLHAVRGRGAFLRGYVSGAIYLALVSWSMSYVVFGAYLALFVVGGLYTAVVGPAMRRMVQWRVPEPLAFALAVTATCWLRAHMVDVPYPHAQPAHAWYGHVALLNLATWGGEVAMNFTLALLGAGVAVIVAAPRRPRSWVVAIVASVALFVPRVDRRGPTIEVDILAIQPGFDVAAILDRDPARRTLLPPFPTGHIDSR